MHNNTYKFFIVIFQYIILVKRTSYVTFMTGSDLEFKRVETGHLRRSSTEESRKLSGRIKPHR